MTQSYWTWRTAVLMTLGCGGLWPALTLAADATNTASGGQLDEIVVTAQKREQSLNDVGMSVDALLGDTLKERMIYSLEDLSHAISGFTFSESPWGTPVLTLRGVGYQDTSLAASPAVTAYIDQAPLSFPILVSHVNFDLDRVEVLKGPQGTLFGQNSTGGAINFVAAKPTDTFAGAESLTYGRFNSVSQEGFISGPLTDTISARFAERTETADGWQRSVTRPGDSNGSVNNVMGRLIVDFHPSDGVKIELNLNGWQDKSQPQAPQFVGINLQHGPANTPAIFATEPFAPANNQAADWNAGLPRRDNTMYQVSLRGDFALPGDITLTSLSSYIQFHRSEADDFDGLPVSVNDFSQNDGKITSFSQEFRVANNQKNAFRWTVGANYQHDSVFQLYNYQYNQSSTGVEFTNVFGPGTTIGQNIFYADQTDRSEAVFANAEFDVSPHWTLKAGLRYTDTELRAVSECGWDYTPPYVTGFLFYEILAANPSKYSPPGCYPLNNLKKVFNGVQPGDPGAFGDVFDQHNVSWQVGVNYKPEPGTLFYANISKGYKAGILPTTGASVFSQYLPINQESLLSYEPGFKLTLLNNTMQLNGDIYYYNYSDKQLRSRNIDPIFANLDVVQNVPKSSVRGAEVELQYRPIPALTLGVSASYMRATIDQFTGISAAGLQANFAGTPMPYSPKYMGSVSGDYVVPFSANKTLFFGTTVSYRSSSCAIIGCETNPPNATPSNVTLFQINGFTLVDLRAGIENDKWRLTMWGKNVFNEYYFNNVNPSYDAVVRYAGMPATYGITGTYKFN